MGSQRKKIRQSGVIPYRIREGSAEVMIITTSSKKHWTIPKGHIEKGYSASESAAKEAFEEAGIEGTIIKPNVGSYTLKKQGRLHQVKVFLFHVTLELEKWPEKKMRKRKWVSLKKAGKKVYAKGLKQLLKDLPDLSEMKDFD